MTDHLCSDVIVNTVDFMLQR